MQVWLLPRLSLASGIWLVYQVFMEAWGEKLSESNCWMDFDMDADVCSVDN